MSFAGFFHTVLLKNDGHVVACGYNHFGQCTIPALPDGVTYSQVSAGATHTVLLKSDGDVDLYVVQRSVRLEGEPCVAKHTPGTIGNCHGVKHLVAAHGHGTSSQDRFESMELSGGSRSQLHYYMIVVDLQPLSERDSGGRNNAQGKLSML